LLPFGKNRWAIIDSCIDSNTRKPAALSYLEQIGVDASVAVKLVVATHWHDDHIGGLSSIVASCPSAKFACSDAVTRKEFVKLAAVFNKRPLLTGPVGSREFQNVFSILRASKRIPIRVSADRPFFTISDATGAIECRFTALSPSDLEKQRFLESITKLMPAEGTSKYRIPDPQPNELSVAVLVQIFDMNILLGADVEEYNDPNRGWSAILASENRPSRKSDIFKIAHHGGASGHHDGIWTTLLGSDPIAVLTPWNRGGGLPTQPDCDRIIARTSRAFSTSRSASKRAKRMPSAVMRTLEEGGIKILEAESPTGYVRMRKIPGGAWVIDLSEPALPLHKFAA
jgi:hypothetical protein